MKRLLTSLTLYGMTVAVAAAQPIQARVNIDENRVLSGTLTGQGNGHILFQIQGAAAAGRIPAARLNSIDFQIEDLSELRQQFKNGAYHDYADACRRLLSPAIPYIQFSSNVSADFVNWMIASFWNGDYKLAIVLADSLKASGDQQQQTAADWYRRLARMEQGTYDEIVDFLHMPEASSFCPEGSAARLYIEARLLQHEGNALDAIRTVTRLVAAHGRDTDWMPQAELLCAELYFELDMPEAAEAVLEDIAYFYTDQGIQKRAGAIAAKQE